MNPIKGRKIGFIGAGQMGSALAKGLLEKGIFKKDEITASDPSPERKAIVEEEIGIRVYFENKECIERSDILVLAVKPQIMDSVLSGIRPFVEERHLLVSIAAGISTAFIEERLDPGIRVVRVMPNTPCLVQEGAAAVSPGRFATNEDVQTVMGIFEAVGVAVSVPEQLIDVVTGLSGSGPAYCFTFIEAMIEGGVLEGLPRDVAQRLAVQTVLGSARLLKELGKHPAELTSMVTSPGGTTIRGLYALEKYGFRRSIMEAISKATERSRELGKGN